MSKQSTANEDLMVEMDSVVPSVEGNHTVDLGIDRVSAPGASDLRATVSYYCTLFELKITVTVKLILMIGSRSSFPLYCR